MSVRQNNVTLGRSLAALWGSDYNPDVLGAPDSRLEFSLHSSDRGRGDQPHLGRGWFFRGRIASSRDLTK